MTCFRVKPHVKIFRGSVRVGGDELGRRVESRESDEEGTDSCRWFFFRGKSMDRKGVEVSTDESGGMFLECVYV